jgi:hypothetical protein
MGSYDATNPQSMNRYAYVLNNPMSFTDPSGLEEVQVCGDDEGCGGSDDGGGGDGGDGDGDNPVNSGNPFVFQTNVFTTPFTDYQPETNPLGYFMGLANYPTTTLTALSGYPVAPSKPESPARQMCEQKAQQQYSQAKVAAVNGATKGFLIGAGVTAGVQGAAGCAVGAAAGGILGGIGTIVLGGEGAFAGAPVGCAVGAVSAVLDGLPQSILVGAVTGGISYWSDTSAAGTAFKQTMQACSQIP